MSENLFLYVAGGSKEGVAQAAALARNLVATVAKDYNKYMAMRGPSQSSVEMFTGSDGYINNEHLMGGHKPEYIMPPKRETVPQNR